MNLDPNSFYILFAASLLLLAVFVFVGAKCNANESIELTETEHCDPFYM